MSCYWDAVDPFWDVINIYDSPEIFLETFAKAPLKPGLLFAAHFCESEVCNGGFYQFFFNPTGVLAPEAVRGFRAIGQNQVAEVVAFAMGVFGSEYPRDRNLRQSMLENLEKKYFDPYDDRFYDFIDDEAGGFEAAADAYASEVAS